MHFEFLEEEGGDEIARQYKKYTSSARYNLNSEEVFCVCRRPDHGELMVACDGCEEWFHFKCMKIDEKYSKLIARFYCKFCKWKGKGQTQWKRKCRLASCYEPIQLEDKSKYCSEAHGLLFIREGILRKGIDGASIKLIVGHVAGDAARLAELGRVFPELEHIRAVKDSKDYSGFPETLASELRHKDAQIAHVSQQLEQCRVKSTSLVKLKAKMKRFNDGLGSDAKKKKSKKADVCLYDPAYKTFHTVETDEAVQASIDQEESFGGVAFDQLAQYYTSGEAPDISVCVKDRRKCARHNGWWNLFNDELFKMTTELLQVLGDLEAEKLDILRDHSIGIYEAEKLKIDISGSRPNSHGYTVPEEPAH